MTITRPGAAIAALLTSTLLLAGCSDDGSDTSRDEPTSASSQTPGQAANPDPQESGGDLAPLAAGTFYKSVLEAQQAAGSFKGTVSTTSNGATMVLNVEGDYTDGNVAAHSQSAPGSAQQLESILINRVMYLRGDGLNLPDGKWLKFDSSDPGNADNPLASVMDLSNPERALAAMDNPKEFALVGPETVEGVETNHYRMALDSATYAANLDLPKEIVGFLPEEIVFDMWVDAENRPAKVVQEFEVQGTKTSTVQTYSDYGIEVAIEAPADADTVTR